MIRNRIKAVVEDPVDTTLVLSALLPAVLVTGSAPKALIGTVATVAAIAVPRIRYSRWFWSGLFVYAGIAYALEWRIADDHVAVAAYWYLAIALSLRGRSDPQSGIAINARRLIALVFLFAVGWKLRSPDFVDGTFFEFTLLTDPRFAPIADAVGGVSIAGLEANRAALLAAPTESTLVSGTGIELVAGALTIGTLAVEGAVAITWLWPGARLRAARQIALAAFCLLTYSIVPVAGFGLVLLAMASSHARTARTRLLYIGGSAALFVWAALWNQLVLG